jgi:hypothetical protein
MESSMQTWIQKAVEILEGLTRTLVGTTPAQSRLNAVAGYDCSNTLFEAFLSKEMMSAHECSFGPPLPIDRVA